MATPTMIFGYDDRFLVSMLEARKAKYEEYGLYVLAIGVGEQIQEVTKWQIAHPDELSFSAMISMRPDGVE